MIIYFTPSLGLFSILNHWRYEQIQFTVRTNRNIQPNDMLWLYNSTPILWSEIDRWNYDGMRQATPPTYSIYTGYSLETYFYIFWVILGIHIYSNVCLKLIFSRDFRLEASALEMFVHGLENCNIPYVWKDWDESKGDVENHCQRFWIVRKELIVTLGVNFLFNSAMLFPLLHTGFSSDMLYKYTSHIIFSEPDHSKTEITGGFYRDKRERR